MTTRDHPQRITPPAPVGSGLKQFGAALPRSNLDAPEPDYLALIRDLPCLSCGMEPSEAAHVRYASAAFGKASGLGKKPHDKFCCPLCAQCHRLGREAQHKRNERAFWENLDINPLQVAERLWERRFDPLAMRMVVVAAIMERKK